MTEWRTINVNDMVRVKLTPRGVQMYHDYWAPYAADNDILESKIVDGWLEEPLWQIAAIFGPLFGNGIPAPIETEIQIQT